MPQLSEATVKRFRRNPLAFDELFRQLQQTDPVAVRWLLEVTESIAPGNPSERQKYAALVLAYYHMLGQELSAQRLGRLLKEPAVAEYERANARPNTAHND